MTYYGVFVMRSDIFPDGYEEPGACAVEHDGGQTRFHALAKVAALKGRFIEQGFCPSVGMMDYWSFWKSFGDFQVVLEVVIGEFSPLN